MVCLEEGVEGVGRWPKLCSVTDVFSQQEISNECLGLYKIEVCNVVPS